MKTQKKILLPPGSRRSRSEFGRVGAQRARASQRVGDKEGRHGEAERDGHADQDGRFEERFGRTVHFFFGAREREERERAGCAYTS